MVEIVTFIQEKMEIEKKKSSVLSEVYRWMPES